METLNKQSVSVDPRISEYENKLNESKFDHFVSTARLVVSHLLTSVMLSNRPLVFTLKGNTSATFFFFKNDAHLPLESRRKLPTTQESSLAYKY